MNYLRAAIAVPVIAVGAMFFTAGTILLMSAHYLSPGTTLFDGWINRVIDGSKAAAA